MLDGPLPRPPVPNTSKIGLWRIEPSGYHVLMGLIGRSAGGGGGRAGAEQLTNFRRLFDVYECRTHPAYRLLLSQSL